MFRKLLFTFLVLCCIGFNSNAQLNVTFRSNMPFPGQLANISGYVDNLGNEYALVGWTSGVTIVNVTNPDSIFVQQTIGGIISEWREIKTLGHYAYVTTEGCCDGLQIIDLGNLPGLVVTKTWKGSGTITGNLSTIHALHIDNNGFLYLFGSNLFNGTAITVSLADPWNPVYLGHLPGNIYVHDGYAYNDTLYACHIYGGYVGFWDVTDKVNPVFITSQTTPGAFTHNSWLNDERTVLFTTDEVNDSYLTAYDITNTSNIKELSRIQLTPGSQSIVHNTHTLNDFEVVSWYKDGVAIIDASRPSNMVVTGYFDTYTQGSGSGFNGCWGVYPYLPSGNLVVSDIDNGLYVLTPNYIRACYLEGVVSDSVTSAPINGAIVTIAGQNLTKQTNLLGEYKTGFVTAGLYNVTVAKAGYYPKSFNNVSLTNGVLTQLDVQLIPVVTITQSGSVTDTQGNPIANATVTFNGALITLSSTSDINGQFTINGFIPDNYNVIGGKWGYLTNCQNQNVNGGLVNIVLAQGYYDDFSLDFNWSVSGPSINAWERAIPHATLNAADTCNPGNDIYNDCGDYAMVTDNAGGGPWDHDVDFGSTVLTSPAFDATIYNDPYLHYSRWYYNGGTTNGLPDDTMKVYLSNGITTVLLETANPSTPDNGSWVNKTFEVNQFLTPTNNMSFRIQVRDSAPVSNIVEGGLDYFYISEGLTSVSESSESILNLKAFPNPFKDNVRLNYNLDQADLPAKLSITDIAGRIIGTYIINDITGDIHIGEHWTPGIYFAKIISVNKVQSISLNKIEK
ncbi:MAG: choice-of-anchor B family protein [Bacteroidota bacterium]